MWLISTPSTNPKMTTSSRSRCRRRKSYVRLVGARSERTLRLFRSHGMSVASLSGSGSTSAVWSEVRKSGHPIQTRPLILSACGCLSRSARFSSTLTVKRSFSVWDLSFAADSRRPPQVVVGSRGNPEPRCIPPAAITQAVRASRLPRR
jgi:hypothetical protein